MNEKRVRDLQESYMSFETSDELVQILIRKNLEPAALEAAKRELDKRGIDPISSVESGTHESVQEASTKYCPFCAEEIKSIAIVCRYCNRDLDDIKTQTDNFQIQHNLPSKCPNCGGPRNSFTITGGESSDQYICGYCNVFIEPND